MVTYVSLLEGWQMGALGFEALPPCQPRNQLLTKNQALSYNGYLQQNCRFSRESKPCQEYQNRAFAGPANEALFYDRPGVQRLGRRHLVRQPLAAGGPGGWIFMMIDFHCRLTWKLAMIRVREQQRLEPCRLAPPGGTPPLRSRPPWPASSRRSPAPHRPTRAALYQ